MLRTTQPTLAEIDAMMADHATYEARMAAFKAAEEERKNRVYNQLLTTLQAGGVVRELGFGNGFTDWRLKDSLNWNAFELSAHLLNRHIGFSTELRFNPEIECLPNTPREAVSEARAAGFTHVLTFGGPLSLGEFETRTSLYATYVFDPERPAINEISEPYQYPREGTRQFIGVWPLIKEGEQAVN